MISHRLSIALIATFLTTNAFATTTTEPAKTTEPVKQQPVAPVTKAVAVLKPTEGNKVQGTVTFTTVEGGVLVVADVYNLTPGKHGFHVHEHGDCSAHDASSAGGHFNPGKTKHGGPDSAERHAGDLGNLEADKDGKAHYSRVDKMITLNGSDSIVTRSVVVHAGEDDFVTQPTGNSGPRIACGVIEKE
jgi:Cu-Zn family superoxide dismutase